MPAITIPVLGNDGGEYYEQRMSSNKCDYFQGSWVYDESYPLYDSTKLSLSLEKDLIVRKMADLTKITSNTDGSLLVVAFPVPNSSYTIDCTGLLSTFTMPEYGLSVLWLKNGFLVDVIYEKIGKVLKLDSISTGNQWLGMDMLIFNTYHWWLHSGRSQTWDYFQVGDKIVKDMDRLEALKIALTTWATCIDHNTDPSKTKVYFQGVAAVHLDPKEWKDPDPSARTCVGQTKPVEGPKYPGPS
uniref:Trichome birefringence-like C-terminal domain-containing protein n=1 Tax=Salix viminalis TaxID=40686 RepID=A0A6N2LKB6_SALVM